VPGQPLLATEAAMHPTEVAVHAAEAAALAGSLPPQPLILSLSVSNTEVGVDIRSNDLASTLHVATCCLHVEPPSGQHNSCRRSKWCHRNTLFI
jgi:hypothetical protein